MDLKTERPQRGKFFSLTLLLLILASFSVGACATAPPKSDIEAYRYYKETNDPLEPTNRAFLKFNRAIEKVLIKPVTKVYRAIIPKPLRKGITNILFNLESPVIFANDMLQGKPKRAWTTLRRFVVNSTVGVGGLLDVGTKIGLERHDEDFGQTLAVYGAREGPYLVLPLFGPSNPRDFVGMIGDIAMDPFFWLIRLNDIKYVGKIRFGLDAVDTYDRHLEDIENLEQTSLDYYAALRSAYRQSRRDDIRDGAPPPIEEFDDDIFDELDEDEDDGGGASPEELELLSLYGEYLSD